MKKENVNLINCILFCIFLEFLNIFWILFLNNLKYNFYIICIINNDNFVERYCKLYVNFIEMICDYIIYLLEVVIVYRDC